MQIRSIEAGPVATNCYLVYDEVHKEGVLIDAPMESLHLMLPYILDNRIELNAIFLTHSHWDHTIDAPAFKRETGAMIYIHKNDKYRLTNPMEYTSIPLPFSIDAFSPDFYYKHGDVFTVSGITLEIRHTPGHTEGGVCIVEHANRIVFTGDTLFNQGVGRVDLPGGDWQTLIHSINEQIFTLPDNYIVQCGHGPGTSIANEKRFNPFLRNNY